MILSSLVVIGRHPGDNLESLDIAPSSVISHPFLADKELDTVSMVLALRLP